MKKLLFLLIGCVLLLASCGTTPIVSTTTTNPTTTSTSVPSTTSTPEESTTSSGNMSEGGKYEDTIPWGTLQ